MKPFEGCLSLSIFCWCRQSKKKTHNRNAKQLLAFSSSDLFFFLCFFYKLTVILHFTQEETNPLSFGLWMRAQATKRSQINKMRTWKNGVRIQMHKDQFYSKCQFRSATIQTQYRVYYMHTYHTQTKKKSATARKLPSDDWLVDMWLVCIWKKLKLQSKNIFIFILSLFSCSFCWTLSRQK